MASGHVGSFHDPLVEDTVTHKRYRADHVIEAWVQKAKEENPASFQDFSVEDLSIEEMEAFLSENQVTSPDGNPLTAPKTFNLLMETELGVISGEKYKVYLRGETAQGIFTNFRQILDTTRVTLPFGIGQIGKSFRNEITTGQFVFRTIEFEQAEIEYFFNPETTHWQELFQSWQESMWNFVTKTLGVREETYNGGNTQTRNEVSTARTLGILTTASHLAGRNCGALLTGLITISRLSRLTPTKPGIP